MKRHILKNIFKTCIAAVFAVSLAGCSFLSVDSGDDSGSGNVAQPAAKAAGTGSTVVRIGVPDYEKFASRAVSSSRAIAPQTKYARLGYSTNGSDFTYLEAIELSSNNAETDTETGLFTVYTLTFSGIPSGTYKEGYLKIQLLGSSADSSAVSEGTNSKEVTVSSEQDAPAEFYTVPASVSESETGSLSAGEMVFLSKEVAPNTVSTLTVTVGDSDTAFPIVALFDSDGKFEKATSLSAETNTVEIDNCGKTKSASYFIGLYTKDTAISSYTTEWKVETYFTKFDAADLYTIVNNSSIAADVTASDDTWTLTGATSSNKANVYTYSSHTIYDYDENAGTGYVWKTELSSNSSDIALKLKVGAGKTVVLRIDGGTGTTLADYQGYTSSRTLTITGTETKTWKPYVADSTYYVEVTGDSDGHFSITGGAWIYGITLADNVIDLSSEERQETSYSISSSVTLNKNYVNLYNCENKSFTIEANASFSGTTSINTASVDGTSATQGKSSTLDFSAAVISYVWKKDGKKIIGATSNAYTATSAGRYSVEVTLELNGEKFPRYYSDSCEVTNVNPTYAAEYYASEISSDEISNMKTDNGTDLTLKWYDNPLYEGTYSIWSEKGSIVTESSGVSIYSSDGASVSEIYICKNFNGSSTAAAPTVGETVSSLKNYVKVAQPSFGVNSVTLDGYFNLRFSSSSEVTSVPFWIVVADSNGKVLAFKQAKMNYSDYNNVKYNYYCYNGGPLTFADLDIGSSNADSAKIGDNAVQTVAAGSQVSLKTASELGLSRVDYDFAGWATSAGATEVDYADGAEISVAEGTTLYAVWKEAVLFTEFTATKLREEFAPGTITEIKVEKNGFTSKDGTWSVDYGVQVKPQSGNTFDYKAGTGYSYTDRFGFNSKNDERGIKLRIGAGQTKILRIDGGSGVNLSDSKAGNDGTIIDISIKGTETITWSPKVCYSTYYVSVTGDADGYVSITTKDTENKHGEIYGIYVVDSLVDISSEKQIYTSVSYDSPTLSLDKTADLDGQDSVDLTVSVKSTPKRKTTIKTISADGTGDVTSDTETKELSDLQWSYQWYKSGIKITGATSETYSASASATYSVEVSYKYTDENGEIQSKSTTKECVVTDSKASDILVTFKKNSKNASIASENYQTVKSGATVALTKAKDLSLGNDGYAFMGWATSADEKVSYLDGANIFAYENTTLYAVWVEKSSGELVGYPNASNEWTLAESGLPADVKDSAGNTILEFAGVKIPGNKNIIGVDIDGNSVGCVKAVGTGGSTGSSRYIKITVPEGKTADVFCAFYSGSSDGLTRCAGIGTKSAKDSFDIVAKVGTSSTGNLSYLSTGIVLSAGTYYVNVDNGINFSAIQIRLYSEN